MPTPRGEAARKLIHVALSIVAAGVVAVLPPLEAAITMAAATALALAVEVVRRVSGRFGAVFARRLGPLLRPRESDRVTGATTLSLGFTIAAVILPGRPALAGILFTGVADAVAAVIGRRWGRHRYPNGKSAEGSLAFLMTCLALCIWPVGLNPLPALAVAAAVTAVEALTVRADDNLYLPLAGAAAMAAAVWVGGPQVFS